MVQVTLIHHPLSRNKDLDEKIPVDFQPINFLGNFPSCNEKNDLLLNKP